ncbi:hypothetical protein EB796_006824 [Bugula neritina]|uniref:VPS9 domain-containing protein n=1 Tax=Bugula neritina TaxID=10212 RepID=A0A7J7KAA0_BUGNE|nr:hypothetical protein EB796_006824 [Bugula neritina]
MKPSPASTKRLVLTYETIIYKRVSEYIIPLFNLRYQKVLDQLCEDMQELSWEDLDIEEEWLLVLLNSRKSCDPDTSTHMLESVTSQLDSDKQAPVTTHDLSLSSSTSSQVVHSDTEKRLLDDVTLVSSSECHNNDEPDTLQTPVPDTLPNGTFYNDSGCHDVWPSPAISPHSSPRDENTSKLFPMQSPESRKCFTSSQRASLKLDLTSDVDVTDMGGATNGAGGGDDAVGGATIDTGGGADNAVGGATNGAGGGADNAVGGATNGAGGGADDAVEMTAELNDLLDSALSFLDEEDEALNRQFSSGEESKSEKKMRSRSADVAKLLSVEPSTPGVKRNRSKSAGAKARGRWNRVRGNVQGEGQMKSPSSPGAEATPAITPPSPSAAQRQDQTRRSVESILLKRRSRRPQSKRGPSTPTVSHKPIIADTRDNLFTEVFKDSIQCLIGMQSRCSPLEKAQLLAKCLRCISRTISELRSQDVATTAADDLVTVAIVMLMNVSLQQFRSIYVQLKFISTYMNSFMDAGIHSFACIQFIGAMHFIQDQILTKKYRQSSNSSKC